MNQGEKNSPKDKSLKIKVSGLNQLASYYEMHADAISFLYDEQGSRNQFFADMTSEKFQECFNDGFILSDEQKACLDYIPKDEADQVEKITRIYDSFSLGDLVTVFECCEAKEDHDTEKKASDEMEQYLVKRPKAYVVTTDRVSRAAFEGKFNNGLMTPVRVDPKKKNKVFAYVTVTKIDNSKVKGLEGLTAYDQLIQATLASLYKAGNRFITPNLIYQTMTHKKNAHCSPEQFVKINRSIDRLRFHHLFIDAREEKEKLNYPDLVDFYDGPAIMAYRRTKILNGQISQGIILGDLPLMYLYSEDKKQLQSYDPALLDTTKGSKTDRVLILEDHLRRRIFSMISNKKLSRTILYDGIYELFSSEISILSPGSQRNAKLELRKSTRNALDHYKSVGFIYNYAETKRKGVDIYFDEDSYYQDYPEDKPSGSV